MEPSITSLKDCPLSKRMVLLIKNGLERLYANSPDKNIDRMAEWGWCWELIKARDFGDDYSERKLELLVGVRSVVLFDMVCERYFEKEPTNFDLPTTVLMMKFQEEIETEGHLPLSLVKKAGNVELFKTACRLGSEIFSQELNSVEECLKLFELQANRRKKNKEQPCCVF